MTKIEIARLAAAINVLRPDWPTASIQTGLEKRCAHKPYHDVAVALVWVATDPDSLTPARLEEDGPWWYASKAGAPTPLPPPYRPEPIDAVPPPANLRELVAEAAAARPAASTEDVAR